MVLVGDAGGTAAYRTWNEQLSGYGEGDHYYGMLDGGDILADVHVGRLSFSNSSLSQLDAGEQDPQLREDAAHGRHLRGSAGPS